MKRTDLLASVFCLSTAAIAVPPTINVAWDETPAPQSPDDYIITTTDPDFPDIELIKGSLTWRIWSTDTDNPNNIGDIGVITSPYADNFALTIATSQAGAGARDVKGVVLDPTNSTNHSSVNLRITGTLAGPLSVQKSTGDDGGVAEVWATEVGADITVPILSDLIVGSVEEGATITANEVGPAPVQFQVEYVYGTLSFPNGIPYTDSPLGLHWLFIGEVKESGVLDFGDAEVWGLLSIHNGTAEGSLMSMGAFLTQLASGGEFAGTLEATDDSGGSIVVDGDISGALTFGGDFYGDIIAENGGSITGDVTINGEFNGNICGANLSPMLTLPENIVIGTFGTNGHICGARPGCGGGTISDSTPPDGTIDARQPHPVDDCSLGARQGIGSTAEPIVITLSEGGANHLDCWALCETGVEAVDTGEGCSALDDNAIASVTETSTGVYEIVLERPISAGYWTQITYLGDDSSVWCASLPGDANGSRGSTSADVTALINYLNETASPPYGIYSTDINHSGALTSADINRLIDLLNGADTFIAWINKSIPAYHPDCGGESLGGGGSEEEDDPEAFAAFLVEYVANADPQGEAATALFESLADAMAGWVVQHFTGGQQAAIVEALSDSELTFASDVGAAKAAEIVERLGN